MWVVEVLCGLIDCCEVAPELARLSAEDSANACRLTGSRFSFLGRGARGSTNRPIHSSVPGYSIGPTVRVTLAMHSISCAGGSTSPVFWDFLDFPAGSPFPPEELGSIGS